ncbi:glycosyltransferase family 31 protein [Coprinopsis sp. MPI-PUGE-AT-0042]|nr:glycosyltransferase family 31 protein [Coprinopsis sp. MPI-PUGE-AT-0042]
MASTKEFSQSRSSRSPSRAGSRPGLVLSLESSASSTPEGSRPASPRQYYAQDIALSGSEDSEGADEVLLLGSRRARRSSSWFAASRGKRRRSGPVYKYARRVIRHPLFPARPITILLTVILFTAFVVSLVLYIKWLLNPDKERLPWRAYCSIPSLQQERPHPSHVIPFYPEVPAGEFVPSFPPPHLEELPPVGVYIGVMTVDKAYERRMIIRSTWAQHARSRNGAGEGDGGRGTSRTLVRFILGQPRSGYERQIQLEMETYNDIVILPIHENMNGGKMHTYFSWASLNAWVPPIANASSEKNIRQFSYSNYTASPPPVLAPHDPRPADPENPAMWVRPDFVIKADDDSFVMLAELEARLRVELHSNPKPIKDLTNIWPRDLNSSAVDARQASPLTDSDPLIHWGYMITNGRHQFMAGELYAFTWNLVDWIGKDPKVKTLTIGAEDQRAADWMRVHPRADLVRWSSERCWIYDHPRSLGIYAHGFLFPSEVSRVKKEMASYLEAAKRAWSLNSRSGHPHAPGESINSTVNLKENMAELVKLYGPPKQVSSYSTTSRFHTRYQPPVSKLSPRQSVEALVEGSAMSKLPKERPIPEGKRIVTPQQAWQQREGRKTQYEGKRVGGTVVVHYIKKHAWYMETALALLDGDEMTDMEKEADALGEGREQDYAGRLQV